MSNTIKLSGDYGYSSYKAPSGLTAGTIIDATQASWIVANSRNGNPDATHPATEGSLPINLYPFQVTNAPQATILGGHILGEVPQASDWQYTYVNSAAVRVADSPGAVIKGWSIDKPWDAIRIAGASQGFTIDGVHVSNSRDDAVEDDDAIGGTLHDSLFDGVFSGISLGDGDVNGSNNTVTMDHVLLRSGSFLYKGTETHGSPFKLDGGTGANEVSPHLRFIDTVVAIEDVHHIGQGRLQHAWDRTVESHGNVFLNLSDEPLPADYPKPGDGWTILQGAAARDYWDKARAGWIDNHDGSPTPTPVPTPGSLLGTSGNDSLVGTANADVIYGLGGNDKIDGKGGADEMHGGQGNDVYYMDNAGDRVIENAGEGTDTINSAVSVTLAGNIENATLRGSGALSVTGNSLNNVLNGNNVANTLKGDAGADTLDGKGGKDVLWGGAGVDTFVFGTAVDANGDLVSDFTHGTDTIRVSGIDANAGVSGDQAFTFLGYASGAKAAGQLWAVEDTAAGVTHIYGNVDGNPAADFHIDLKGVHLGLTAADFHL